MTTRDKFAWTWTAITIIFRVWFPKKREALEWHQSTAEDMESLCQAQNAIIPRILDRYFGRVK